MSSGTRCPLVTQQIGRPTCASAEINDAGPAASSTFVKINLTGLSAANRFAIFQNASELNARIEITENHLRQFHTGQDAFVLYMKLSFAVRVLLNARKGGMISLPYVFS